METVLTGGAGKLATEAWEAVTSAGPGCPCRPAFLWTASENEGWSLPRSGSGGLRASYR